MNSRAVVGLWVATAMLVVGPQATAGGGKTGPSSANPAGGLRQCLKSLNDTGNVITCNYVTMLTEEERADMRRLTRELLQDATCRVAVQIDRGLVTPALEKADHEFVSPAQPVTCTIKTKESSFDVSGKFAPKVTFKDGKATYATPGLSEVTGVSKVIAWPVVQYVNYSPGIRKNMIDIVNAYRDMLARR